MITRLEFYFSTFCKKGKKKLFDCQTSRIRIKILRFLKCRMDPADKNVLSFLEPVQFLVTE